MLLTIDVGNTTVSVGIFKRDRLIFSTRIASKKDHLPKYYYGAFKKIIGTKKIDAAVIASVVPEITAVLRKTLRANLNIRTFIVGADLIAPIKNLYKDPRRVGQDRLVNAYAGYRKFGGGLIIIDFGTAVTFDVVSKKGAYMGGIIAPGIRTGLDALSEKTALLPRITLKETRALIGKDTATSMRSGALNGLGAMCDGLVAKIRRTAGRDYKVILTGGDAELMSHFCDHELIRPNITLDGLRLIYQYYFNKKGGEKK